MKELPSRSAGIGSRPLPHFSTREGCKRHFAKEASAGSRADHQDSNRHFGRERQVVLVA